MCVKKIDTMWYDETIVWIKPKVLTSFLLKSSENYAIVAEKLIKFCDSLTFEMLYQCEISCVEQ